MQAYTVKLEIPFLDQRLQAFSVITSQARLNLSVVQNNDKMMSYEKLSPSTRQTLAMQTALNLVKQKAALTITLSHFLFNLF